MFFFIIGFFIILSKQSEYDLASSLILEAKYKEALKPLTELIKKNPNDSRALNLLGAVYQSLNETDKAETYFFKALSSDTKNNEARLNLAAISFSKGFVKKALLLYNEVLEQDKDNLKALESLAIIMLSLDKYDDAKVFYKRIVDIDKNRLSLNLGLGVISLNKLEIKEAREFFLKELVLYPENIDAMFNLALAYEYDLKGIRYGKDADYGKAIEYYKKVLEENANFSLAALNLGIIYAKNKDYKEAIKITEAQIKKNNPFIDKIYYNLACFYSLDKDTDNAVKYLGLAIKNGFKDFDKIKSDPDLDHIRNEKKYIKLLKTK